MSSKIAVSSRSVGLKMVAFGTYVGIAYEVAEQKGIRLEGPGTQDVNQQFMSQLADAYNSKQSRRGD